MDLGFIDFSANLAKHPNVTNNQGFELIRYVGRSLALCVNAQWIWGLTRWRLTGPHGLVQLRSQSAAMLLRAVLRSRVSCLIPDIVTRIAANRCVVELVAIHTGNHRNIFLLPEGGLLLYGAMTHCTAYLRIEMCPVAKEDEIG